MSALPYLVLLAIAAQDAPSVTSESAPEANEPLEQEDESVLLDEVVVEGRATNLVGIASSATEGKVGREELERRPILRPGDLMETVPGVVITQHSGAGKGNQFFLRGFNLDHGTDFSTRVNGIPNNLPSHGHGQGYNDLTFLIPELVEVVEFRKGPYAADAGDFSSAGSVSVDYVTKLPHGIALLEQGRFGRNRALVADSVEVGGGDLLFAAEISRDDGPWDVPENFKKFSGVLRWTTGDENSGSNFTAQSYDGSWTSTDHVAQRAIDSGLIDRFGSLDPTSGGESYRHSVSGRWWGSDAQDSWWVQAYTYRYDLDLYSNFTYFLNDPVNGDQFLQEDARWVQGLEGEYEFGPSEDADARFSTSRVGFQFRNDFVDNALRNTVQRQVLSTTREDDIRQTSLGVYAENETAWAEKFRTTVGLRADVYQFDVDSDLEVNSGDEDDVLVSPKVGAVFGPWNDTEFYVQAGFGFHSNDARGTVIQDDPSTPAPNDGVVVDPLVRQKGAEIGVRTTAIEGLQSTVSLWYLESDSELLFVGDAGNTEATGATERYGLEIANFWQANDWLTLDLDAAISEARFKDGGDEDHVPGAIDTVVALGATARSQEGHYVAVRGRYFGPRDLIEDGSVQSSSSFLVNAHGGYRFSEDWQLRLSVFNLFDREVNDIEYYYPSRLEGEPAGPVDGGFEDIHLHPAVPFTFVVGLYARF